MSAENLARVRDPEQVGQGADQHVHLTYFDQATQASFVWDGISEVVEVSIGGYAEPVDHTIPAPDPDYLWGYEGGDIKYLLREGMSGFQGYCAEHVEGLPVYECGERFSYMASDYECRLPLGHDILQAHDINRDPHRRYVGDDGARLKGRG